MSLRSPLSLALLILPITFWAQEAPIKTAPLSISLEIKVELKTDSSWVEVDPRTVFRAGDTIRFQFRTSAGGYLYVLHRNPEGLTSWIFPRSNVGQRSRVESGTSYLIPGKNDSFVVEGPAGFEVTYWILSVAPVAIRDALIPVAPIQPNTLQPRCRTQAESNVARCLDDNAGAHSVQQSQSRGQDPKGGSLVARDLKFRTEQGSTQVSAADSSNGVLLYEFRIAHN